MIALNGRVIAQGSQFSLADVEVVTRRSTLSPAPRARAAAAYRRPVRSATTASRCPSRYPAINLMRSRSSHARGRDSVSPPPSCIPSHNERAHFRVCNHMPFTLVFSSAGRESTVLGLPWGTPFRTMVMPLSCMWTLAPITCRPRSFQYTICHILHPPTNFVFSCHHVPSPITHHLAHPPLELTMFGGSFFYRDLAIMTNSSLQSQSLLGMFTQQAAASLPPAATLFMHRAQGPPPT